MVHTKQNEVLDFWFGEDPLNALDNADRWFEKDESFDSFIRLKFADMMADAASGAFDDWGRTARGALALTLLLDQFPRNVYRGDKLAFANDAHARRIAEMAIDRGLDKELSATERVFLYLPLEHSEDIDAQKRAVTLFEDLINKAQAGEHAFITQALAYALAHRDVIERFGRFPHRNDSLGRDSSRDEQAFLKTPNSSF